MYVKPAAKIVLTWRRFTTSEMQVIFMPKFKSPQEFLSSLIENPRVVHADYYGREWYYSRYAFFFKDLGEDHYVEKLDCLHLYGTPMLKLD